MSVGFLLASPTDAVIWRGPKKNGLIKQFLRDVDWGEMDCLLVDTPPGTSDEHLSIVQYLSASGLDGAVVVTTPQEVNLLLRFEGCFCFGLSDSSVCLISISGTQMITKDFAIARNRGDCVYFTMQSWRSTMIATSFFNFGSCTCNFACGNRLHVRNHYESWWVLFFSATWYSITHKFDA